MQSLVDVTLVLSGHSNCFRVNVMLLLISMYRGAKHGLTKQASSINMADVCFAMAKVSGICW